MCILFKLTFLITLKVQNHNLIAFKMRWRNVVRDRFMSPRTRSTSDLPTSNNGINPSLQCYHCLNEAEQEIN